MDKIEHTGRAFRRHNRAFSHVMCGRFGGGFCAADPFGQNRVQVGKNGCMVGNVGRFPNLKETTGHTGVFCGQNLANC